MAEDRQAEGRLADEDIAGHDLEGAACRVGRALVVAGGNDAHSAMLYSNLRRAQHVACRMKGDGDSVDGDRLAKPGCLRRTGESLAVAKRHDVQCFLGGEHCTMAGTGVVGMAVSDQRTRDGSDRVDEEISRCAVKSFRLGAKQISGAHVFKIGLYSARGRLPSETSDSPLSEQCEEIARFSIPFCSVFAWRFALSALPVGRDRRTALDRTGTFCPPA